MEEALVFTCRGARLVGILHRPVAANARAVLLVVGGPQYRVGSHRQFVLLARHLARQGTPVLRFDYRGMGDSDGPRIGFEDTSPDIEAALDALQRSLPDVREIVLWGLCDAASAALLYAFRDSRVRGLVLVNPWVRQEQSEAKAYLRHYYAKRFLDAEQWKRLLGGKTNVLKSIRELLGTLKASLGSKTEHTADGGDRPSFVVAMRDGLQTFEGNVLFILSGDDLTASEFKDEVRRSAEWARAVRREAVTTRELPEANHTFSRRVWREQVAAWTQDFMESW